MSHKRNRQKRLTLKEAINNWNRQNEWTREEVKSALIVKLIQGEVRKNNLNVPNIDIGYIKKNMADPRDTLRTEK